MKEAKQQTLLSLEKEQLIGKTLIGHPADGGRPCTLGRITDVRHHSQSTVIDLDKKGSPTKIALEQERWMTDGDKSLVNCEPPRPMQAGGQSRKYVRLTTKPSMMVAEKNP